jgi:hypothetical protein
LWREGTETVWFPVAKVRCPVLPRLLRKGRGFCRSKGGRLAEIPGQLSIASKRFGSIKIYLDFERRYPKMNERAETTMPSMTKKFTPEIDAQLYEEMVAVARQNGQSQRFVLEQALTFYLRTVVPSQHLVRSEVMNAFEQSVALNRDLLQRLAK